MRMNGSGAQRRPWRGRRNQSRIRTTATTGSMGFRRGRNQRISPSTNRRSGRRKAQAAGRVRVGKQVQSAARTMPMRRQAAGQTAVESANTRPTTPQLSRTVVAIPVRRRRSANSACVVFKVQSGLREGFLQASGWHRWLSAVSPVRDAARLPPTVWRFRVVAR